MQMVKTKDRFPGWWPLYYLLRIAYFCLGIPFLLLFIIFGMLSITSSKYVTQADYIYTYVCLFLLIAPCLWLYTKAKRKKNTIHYVVQKIKDTGYFSPEKGFEGFSLITSTYFGIDIRKGTILYIRIYPNNIMDVIGLDIHNFTRTVTEDKELKIYTKYVNMPMIPVTSWCTSPSSAANTMHAMAERSYDYPVDFPRMIQEKRKEWEKVAGIPVAEVF